MPVNGSLPATAAEFTSTASIASVKVGSDTGSDISAYNLGKVSVKVLHVANGGVPFGFAAHLIGSLSGREDVGSKFSLRKITTAAALDAQLAKEHLTLTGTDLLISII